MIAKRTKKEETRLLRLLQTQKQRRAAVVGAEEELDDSSSCASIREAMNTFGWSCAGPHPGEEVGVTSLRKAAPAVTPSRTSDDSTTKDEERRDHYLPFLLRLKERAPEGDVPVEETSPPLCMPFFVAEHNAGERDETVRWTAAGVAEEEKNTARNDDARPIGDRQQEITRDDIIQEIIKTFAR